ncbi:RrF2 family transcriptional regulator [Litchfieldella anticariensis]|nr:Rrf2 family transcriptional regulator [Halomonas anticariensis]
MSEGVEWGLHCCVTLAWLEAGTPVPTARLAAQYELPPPYLSKCLQALVRGGILVSSAGKKGGVRLARPPTEISLLDVVLAIEGSDYAFRCNEIRQRGMGSSAPASDFLQPCAIAAAMHEAERGWRKELAKTSLADLASSAPRKAVDSTRHFFAS